MKLGEIAKYGADRASVHSCNFFVFEDNSKIPIVGEGGLKNAKHGNFRVGKIFLLKIKK